MRRQTGFRARAIALTTVAFAVTALCLPATGQSRPERASAAASPGLEGYWRSAGYGLVLRFEGERLRLFQTTSISCQPAALARRAKRSTDSIVYEIVPKASLPVLDVDTGELEIKPGGSPSVKRLRVPGAISEIVLERIGRRPKTCAKPLGDGPRRNFEIFWRTYAENYPFFDLHGVDWDAEHARVRAALRADTGRRRLFRLLRSTIKPLEDAHTGLGVPGLPGAFYFGERPDPQPVSPNEFKRARQITAGYLTTTLRSFAQGRLAFGLVDESIGYLRIRSFSGYTKRPGIGAQRQALDRALDAAFRKPLDGLVIDLRQNGGGSDVLGVDIASRLTDTPYLAYSKRARSVREPSGFTRAQRVLVEPSDDSRFSGPVAVLTSRYSVSAAETFAQALILRRPEVARIGESTQGVFSDVLIRALPNDSLFGLPNEVYLTAGESYDGAGIPPTIDTGLVFDRANIEAGRDPELDRALEFLR